MLKYVPKFVALVAVIAAILLAAPAVAQAPTLDSVQINNPLEDMPAAQGNAFVSVLGEGQALTGLPPEAFSVYVDGERLDPGAVSVQPSSPGVAVAVLVDISGSMDEPGILTDRRLTDAQQFARQIVEGLNDEDWVGLVGFGSELTPVENLTFDHGRVLNTISQLPQLAGERAADQRGFTHLFDAVSYASDMLSDNTDPDVRAQTDGMRKVIIVFSDGNDTDSAVSRQDAQRAANDNRISVYTVTLCSEPGDGDNRFRCQSGDVRWLTNRTNGESLALEQASDQGEIQSLFQRLSEQRNQYEVNFEFHEAKGVHRCRVEVNADGALQNDERDCFSPLELPEIAITSPTEGTRFTREQAEAGAVPIDVALTFPDGASRNPDKIEYLVNGQPYTSTVNPAYDAVPPVPLDLSDLPGGDYTLVAILDDPYLEQRNDSRPLVTVSLDPWQPPDITLTAPITKVQTSKGMSVTMTVDAAFSDGVPRDVSVNVHDEGVGTIAEASGFPPFEVTWLVENARHGEHLVFAEVLDGKTGIPTKSNEEIFVFEPTLWQAVIEWLLHNWYWLLLFIIVLALLFFLWRRKPAFLAPVTSQIKQLTTRLSLSPAFAKLVTMQGPHKGEYMIRDQITNLGRDQDQCTMVIPGDPAISNVHAVIQRDPRGIFWIKDVSRNGTFINSPGRPVQKDPNWTPLNDGDIIYVGQTQLQFQVLGKTTQRLPTVP
ncbi:MAG: VWA domain-containing protein [Anaerolineae bacterium]|nr:VWA domain-containing protein [Anaerolineae bacterium]MCB0203859.1 VWA domain-containing protein [Anaerolineae bacterium]